MLPSSDGLTRGKAWVFQLLGWAHPLILLTCENMTGLMESSPSLCWWL